MIRHLISSAILMMMISSGAAAAPQERDAYVRHELLDPATSKFHVVYETSVIRPKAKYYFNTVHKGTVVSDIRASDLATGKLLDCLLIDDQQAKAEGLVEADPALNYIRVKLVNPVADDGRPVRIRIEKTYVARESYSADGNRLIFNRSIGVSHGSVVLPPQYSIVSNNFPSQVIQEADGRLNISFLNTTATDAIIHIEARKTVGVGGGVRSSAIRDRAIQRRSSTYVLNAPESNSFDVTHNYSEDTPGVDRYVDVMKFGALSRKPYAINLDTGAKLIPTVKKGVRQNTGTPKRQSAITITYHFPPVKTGRKLNLRIFESQVDSHSYRVTENELVFNRRFDGPEGAVVLPIGWSLTGASVPAFVDEAGDHRTRVNFRNPRNDEMVVLITAHRTSEAAAQARGASGAEPPYFVAWFSTSTR